MSYETVIVEVSQFVGRVTLNRPEGVKAFLEKRTPVWTSC